MSNNFVSFLVSQDLDPISAALTHYAFSAHSMHPRGGGVSFVLLLGCRSPLGAQCVHSAECIEHGTACTQHGDEGAATCDCDEEHVR